MNEIQEILSSRWNEVGEVIANSQRTRDSIRERFNANRRLQIIGSTPAFSEFETAIELLEQEYERLQPLVEPWLRGDSPQQEEFNEIITMLYSMQDSIEHAQTLLASISDTVEN